MLVPAPWIQTIVIYCTLLMVSNPSVSSQPLGLSINANLGIGIRPPKSTTPVLKKRQKSLSGRVRKCCLKKFNLLRQKIFLKSHFRVGPLKAPPNEVPDHQSYSFPSQPSSGNVEFNNVQAQGSADYSEGQNDKGQFGQVQHDGGNTASHQESDHRPQPFGGYRINVQDEEGPGKDYHGYKGDTTEDHGVSGQVDQGHKEEEYTPVHQDKEHVNGVDGRGRRPEGDYGSPSQYDTVKDYHGLDYLRDKPEDYRVSGQVDQGHKEEEYPPIHQDKEHVNGMDGRGRRPEGDYGSPSQYDTVKDYHGLGYLRDKPEDYRVNEPDHRDQRGGQRLHDYLGIHEAESPDYGSPVQYHTVKDHYGPSHDVDPPRPGGRNTFDLESPGAKEFRSRFKDLGSARKYLGKQGHKPFSTIPSKSSRDKPYHYRFNKPITTTGQRTNPLTIRPSNTETWMPIHNPATSPAYWKTVEENLKKTKLIDKPNNSKKINFFENSKSLESFKNSKKLVSIETRENVKTSTNIPKNIKILNAAQDNSKNVKTVKNVKNVTSPELTKKLQSRVFQMDTHEVMIIDGGGGSQKKKKGFKRESIFKNGDDFMEANVYSSKDGSLLRTILFNNREVGGGVDKNNNSSPTSTKSPRKSK